MTAEEYKDMEALLARFFDGATDGEEEEALYRFFSEGKDIPEEWAHLRPVMAYFGGGMAEEEAAAASAAALRRKGRLRWAAVAAATALLVLAAGFSFLRDRAFDPYEGSCVIQGGVRITDMDVIRPELEAAMQRVMEGEAEMERLLASAEEAEREAGRMLDEVNRIFQTE
ncbi:MAG: hypothetical protein LBP25_02645 [Tannerellaceae bacterium]|nr:hypothetical protein [Tannerellaceae bacterium]